MISRRYVLGAAAALPLAAPSLAAPESDRVMRFIPQSELNSIDPAWIPAANVRTHGYLVFDTLYGIDSQYKPQPQMVEGASVENDDRLWELRLRPGLAFHDGTPVLARDCVASINRFCARDSMGQALMAATDELSTADDRTIRFRLKRKFPLLPDALASTSSFMCAIMPERLAQTDPFKQVTEMIGSGPYRYLANERVPGARVAYARNTAYRPRDDGPLEWTAGPKIAHFDRIEWSVISDAATASAALQNGEADRWEYVNLDLVPLLRQAPGIKLAVLDQTGLTCNIRMNQAIPWWRSPAQIRRCGGPISASSPSARRWRPRWGSRCCTAGTIQRRLGRRSRTPGIAARRSASLSRQTCRQRKPHPTSARTCCAGLACTSIISPWTGGWLRSGG